MLMTGSMLTFSASLPAWFNRFRCLARCLDPDNEAQVRFFGISGKPFLAILKDTAHSQHGLSISIIPSQA
jgi:hypothetical protein